MDGSMTLLKTTALVLCPISQRILYCMKYSYNTVSTVPLVCSGRFFILSPVSGVQRGGGGQDVRVHTVGRHPLGSVTRRFFGAPQRLAPSLLFLDQLHPILCLMKNRNSENIK